MAVSLTRNFGPLDAIQILTVQDWRRVGILARERIITRTQQGQDQDGQDFAPYSPGYAALKAELGASARPNLQLSGEMLRSITVEPDDTGVTLAIL